MSLTTYVVGVRNEDETLYLQFTDEDNYMAYSTTAELLSEALAYDLESLWSDFSGEWDDVTVHRNHIPKSDHTIHLFDPSEWAMSLYRNDGCPQPWPEDHLVTLPFNKWAGKYDVSV